LLSVDAPHILLLAPIMFELFLVHWYLGLLPALVGTAVKFIIVPLLTVVPAGGFDEMLTSGDI
jgi:hypothetical protein